jgi:hypothetical protein
VKLLKGIICFFAGVIIFVAIILIAQFVVNPKYSFPEPHPFKGEYLYNPYDKIDSTRWVKANFHVHTRSHFGMTNGADSNQLVDRFYRYFGYGVIGISDYQKINQYEGGNKWFIPEYEHGFMYYKNHQLVLNAKKVSWIDYFFYQTLSNKQYIIDHLKKDSTVVLTINHPALRQGYSYNDFKYLGNYNCVEISNNDRLFTSYYDTILSAGHPVFLMANDDAHNLTKIIEGCHSFNLINSLLVRDSILQALRTGCFIGVNFNVAPFKTNEEKRAALEKLPEIRSITLRNDTFDIRLSKPVKRFRFIGQNGTERKRVTGSLTATCLFGENDTYIRTEIECEDGTLYFLNPVFRYDGKQLTDYFPSFDVLKTWAWRSVVLFVLLVIFLIRLRIKLRRT